MHVTNKFLSITFSTFSALALTLCAEEDEDDLRMERETTRWPLTQAVSGKDIDKAAEGWPKQFAGHKIRFIRLDHGGPGWDDGMAEPVAELNLMQDFANSMGLKSAQRGESHRMALLAKYPDDGIPPFVYLTGNGAMGRASQADCETLRQYCLKGGMIIANAGNTDFHKSFLEFMNQVFPDKKLVEIAADDVIYQFPNALAVGAPFSLKPGGAKPLGIKEGDRWIVFYHPGDLNDTWKSPDHTDATPEMRKAGMELGKNILYYAFNQWCSKTLRETLSLVKTHRIAKNFAMAMSELDALKDIAGKESQVQVYMARAEVFYDMENYVSARDEIKRVLEHDPKHADALILRGKCQLKMLDDESKRELECFIDAKVINEVKLGDPITVNLLAPSLEFTGNIEVVITSGLGDREVIILQKLEADKTRFRAQLQTMAGKPQSDDKILQTQVGDEISIEYSASAKERLKIFEARATKMKIVSGN